MLFKSILLASIPWTLLILGQNLQQLKLSTLIPSIYTSLYGKIFKRI